MVVYSGQGKTLKNAGWDFSMSGLNSTGTVKSVRPPQVRERRSEISNKQSTPRKTMETGRLRVSSSDVVPNESTSDFDFQIPFHDNPLGSQNNEVLVNNNAALVISFLSYV